MKTGCAWLWRLPCCFCFRRLRRRGKRHGHSGALPEILDRIYDTAQVDDERAIF